MNKKEETFKFPFDALSIILNFWHAMLFINYEDQEFVEKIQQILEMYKKYNNLIGDEDCYERLYQQIKNTNEPKKNEYMVRMYDHFKEEYINPSILYSDPNCSCNGLTECDYCKTKPEYSSCSKCNKDYLYRYNRNVCMVCYINDNINYSKIHTINNTDVKKTTYNIEQWIVENHKLVLLGRPCLIMSLVKGPSKKKANQQIIENLYSLVKDCDIVCKNFNRSQNKALSGFGMTWKNIENKYCYTMVGWALARTVFTEKGCNYFDKFNSFIQEIQQNINNTRDHNPCTTLETTYLIEQVVEKEDEIHKPIEINETLKAVDIVVSFLLKSSQYVNRDGSIWKKVSHTKMTFKKTKKDISSFLDKLLFILGHDKELVKSQLSEIKTALSDSDIDENLITPVPRISMTYRMIELKDGFFDIINKCIYRDQNEFACWIYCQDHICR